MDDVDSSTKDFGCLSSEIGLVIRETSAACGALYMQEIIGEG